MKKGMYFWILLITFAFLFATWLMFHTFSYDGKTSSMLIAAKAHSDFGAHIPMIRSFSFGDNWPPEYPLFPGGPIRYHFLFYFFVGMLEKIGFRIDYALNIPSIIGFAGLMIGIALLAQKLFHDRRVTLLSVIFFLFNGSLSFLRFFETQPLSSHSLIDIVTNTTFPSFAPWGEGEITAFWNLNIYTNQRHLAFAFALSLLFIGILLFIEKKPWKTKLLFMIPEVVILALLPYFHQPMLIIIAVYMICFFLFFPRLRGILLFIGALGTIYIIPQILPLLSAGENTIRFEPWYLMASPHTLRHAMSYWFSNIGLHLFLIPLGWILAPKYVKKITAPLLFIFLVPNLFQFSVEIAANHKFFNFFLIIGNMLSAYALIHIFNKVKKLSLFIRIMAYWFIGLLVFILVFSGIIDFFPVFNDGKMPLQDIQKNEIAIWIHENTPPNAVFLNSSFFFHPASLVGRKIFLGWPYFSWSAGYDTNGRMEELKNLYETRDTKTFCSLIQKHHISYITYQEPTEISEIQFSVHTLEKHATRVYVQNMYSIWIPLCKE